MQSRGAGRDQGSGWWQADKEDSPCKSLPNSGWRRGEYQVPQILLLLSWVLIPPNQLSVTADPSSYKTLGSSSPAPLLQYGSTSG